MNPAFEITDKSIIYEVLDNTEYGTLALSDVGTPYAVPVNFVRIDENIYFHGALRNRKMRMLGSNPKVSFSVVENYSLIASYMSSTDGLACPATQFFKSVSIDGVVKIVESREEKAAMFEAMMRKLQPEGGYKGFDDEAYDKVLHTIAVVKIVPTNISCKFKFGQHLSDERFDMIIDHLQKRGDVLDAQTIAMMKALRK